MPDILTESMRWGSSPRKWRAVLITDLSPALAPLLKAWTASGGEWAAIAALRPRERMLRRAKRYAFWAPQWSWTNAIRTYTSIEHVRFFDRRSGWEQLARELAPLNADLVISAYVMDKIPADFLAQFPLGGVNLHPAILPDLPGPRPLDHMIARQLYRDVAGVTLHVMNEKFDAGPIIATATLNPAAWRSDRHYPAAVSGAMSALVESALPAWCSGSRSATTQPPENGFWAGIMPEGFAVSDKWTFDDLIIAARFLCNRSGLFVVAEGTRAYIGPRIVRIGDRTGEEVIIGRSHLEFDVADARVIARSENALLKPFARFAKSVKWAYMHPLPPTSVS